MWRLHAQVALSKNPKCKFYKSDLHVGAQTHSQHSHWRRWVSKSFYKNPGGCNPVETELGDGHSPGHCTHAHTAASPCVSGLLVPMFPGPLEDIRPACAHVETPGCEPFSRCYKEDVSRMQTHLGAAEGRHSFSNPSNCGWGRGRGLLSAGAGEALEEEEDRAAHRPWGESRALDASFQGPENRHCNLGTKLPAGEEHLGAQVTRMAGCIPILGTSVHSRATLTSLP